MLFQFVVQYVFHALPMELFLLPLLLLLLHVHLNDVRGFCAFNFVFLLCYLIYAPFYTFRQTTILTDCHTGSYEVLHKGAIKLCRQRACIVVLSAAWYEKGLLTCHAEGRFLRHVRTRVPVVLAPVRGWGCR